MKKILTLTLFLALIGCDGSSSSSISGTIAGNITGVDLGSKVSTFEPSGTYNVKYYLIKNQGLVPYYDSCTTGKLQSKVSAYLNEDLYFEKIQTEAYHCPTISSDVRFDINATNISSVKSLNKLEIYKNNKDYYLIFDESRADNLITVKQFAHESDNTTIFDNSTYWKFASGGPAVNDEYLKKAAIKFNVEEFVDLNKGDNFSITVHRDKQLYPTVSLHSCTFTIKDNYGTMRGEKVFAPVFAPYSATIPFFGKMQDTFEIAVDNVSVSVLHNSNPVAVLAISSDDLTVNGDIYSIKYRMRCDFDFTLTNPVGIKDSSIQIKKKKSLQ